MTVGRGSMERASRSAGRKSGDAVQNAADNEKRSANASLPETEESVKPLPEGTGKTAGRPSAKAKDKTPGKTAEKKKTAGRKPSAAKTGAAGSGENIMTAEPAPEKNRVTGQNRIVRIGDEMPVEFL